MTWNTVLNILLSLANIFLVVIILKQLDESKKATIDTRILTEENKITDEEPIRQTIRDTSEEGKSELSYLYIHVANLSEKNVAKDLEIEITFDFEDEELPKKEALDYLNPQEVARILYPYGEIYDFKEEYFGYWIKKKDGTIEEVEDKHPKKLHEIVKVLPKEQLEVKVTIEVKWNSLFPILKHKIKNTYQLEFLKFSESASNFEKHPVISNLSIRNDIPIHSMSFRQKQNESNR